MCSWYCCDMGMVSMDGSWVDDSGDGICSCGDGIFGLLGEFVVLVWIFL